MTRPGTTRILGVAVDMLDIDGATDAVMSRIESGQRIAVAVTGVHGVMESQDDPVFKAVLNRVELNVPDGMPLVWIGRRRGFAATGRVFGPDFMLRISERMAAGGHSAFYYGGQEGVAEALAREMERRFPGIRTAGRYCPPFRALTADEEDAIAQTINASGADVVWIGLSTPKQEKWMDRFRPRLTAPVLAAVGAAFDYNTGRLSRAPRWMQRSGLEWLYRLIQEPRRLWRRYARNNPRFVWYLILERLGLRRFD